MTTPQPPLAALRVLELGSHVAVPYLGKLLVDAGAEVVKIESPDGDPLRNTTASGHPPPDGDDSAWFRFLNAGKHSRRLDLAKREGRADFASLAVGAHVILDDHQPRAAEALEIEPDAVRAMNPDAVVATVTPFGWSGPWRDRPANDFTLQALVGSTEIRGVVGSEPVSVGGRLGDVTAGAFAAPVVMAAIAAGSGAHLDFSRYEAMMSAFQTYRPIYEALAPDHRTIRQIEIPSIEPAADGLVGYCCVTGQQWSDFCAMIGHPEMAADDGLATFDLRMRRREEVWEKIRSFTTQHTVDDLVELAAAFRIPCGPVGTGDAVAAFDHFVQREVFVQNPHGFIQPRPPYQLTASLPAPLRAAPELDDGRSAQPARPTGRPVPTQLPAKGHRPLEGIRVVDLSAFWAGPIATSMLQALGADLVKIESHVRLDGMRWASGLRRDRRWELSPVFHAANAGKRAIALDLTTEHGRELTRRLIADADVVVENYSPRVMEHWELGWDQIHDLNPRAVLTRMPAFGLDGPWRDRVGFAMTIEQVSGLANRTGQPGDLPLMPKGVCDPIAGMHAAFATILALLERERTGVGQLVEVPLIETGLNAAAEQVIEWSAYGTVLERTGNRSPHAVPQGLYESAVDDVWLAVSVETSGQWEALVRLVDPDLSALDRRRDHDRVDQTLAAWARERTAGQAAEALVAVGVPAAECVHPNDTGNVAHLDARGFFQWADHPIAGPLPYFSFPVVIDGQRLPVGGPAPVLGQHNHEILWSIGLDDPAIEALESAGVIGDWPSGVADTR